MIYAIVFFSALACWAGTVAFYYGRNNVADLVTASIGPIIALVGAVWYTQQSDKRRVADDLRKHAVLHLKSQYAAVLSQLLEMQKIVLQHNYTSNQTEKDIALREFKVLRLDTLHKILLLDPHAKYEMTKALGTLFDPLENIISGKQNLDTEALGRHFLLVMKYLELSFTSVAPDKFISPPSTPFAQWKEEVEQDIKDMYPNI